MAEAEALDVVSALASFRRRIPKFKPLPASMPVEVGVDTPTTNNYLHHIHLRLFAPLPSTSGIKGDEFTQMSLFAKKDGKGLGGGYVRNAATGKDELLGELIKVQCVVMRGPPSREQAAAGGPSEELTDCPVWHSRTGGNSHPAQLLRLPPEWLAWPDRLWQMSDFLFWLAPRLFTLEGRAALAKVMEAQVRQLAGEEAAEEVLRLEQLPLSQGGGLRLRLATFGFLGETARGDTVFVTRPLYLVMGKDSWWREWGEPEVQSETPGIPWFLSDEEPSDPKQLRLWRRRCPLLLPPADAQQH